MELKIVTVKPEEIKYPKPLLFVHGSWHGSWCWEEYFMPYFVEKGFECHAINIRGHGGSPNNKSLRFTKISDYVEDLSQVYNKIKNKPILIAHSMGTLITQRFLEKETAPAAVLLAPIPPSGVIKITLKVAFKYPLSFLKANLLWKLYPLVNSKKKAKWLFFDKDIDDKKLTEYANQLQDESFLAFLGMLILSRPRPKKVKIDGSKVLIVGGGKDNIFSYKQINTTAKAYNTTPVLFDDEAHDLMLGNGWKEVANSIIDWIGKLDIQ